MWFAGLVIGGLLGSLGGFGSAVVGAILGTVMGAMIGAFNKSDSERAASGQPASERETSEVPERDIETRLLDIERKVDHIYKALADIHWRLVCLEPPGKQPAALEKPGMQREPEPDVQSSVPPVAAQPGPIPTAMDYPGRDAAPASPVPAAISQHSVLTVEQAVALDGLGATPLEAGALSAPTATSPAPDAIPAVEEPVAEPADSALAVPDRKWLVGLCIGAVLGLMGGFSSAVMGAILGTVAGMVLSIYLESQRASKAQETREPYTPSEEGAEPAAADAGTEPPRAPNAVGVTADVASVKETPLPAAAASVSEPIAQVDIYNEPAAQDIGPRDEAVAPVAAPPATGGPAWWQRLLAGNVVAKVGAVILFFGVGFLLKFAYDHAVVPVPVRLLGVALCGLGMVYGGWWLRGRRRLYGLILQGAGIGVLYLDVFFALKVFALIHPTAGFALFMVLGIAATLLAVRQDAKVLAVLGLTGAFLAPVLAGSREGNHVLLFSYYTLLNSFILAISWFKAWRDLNLTGFIFTFVVGVAWGAQNYRPELFGSVEPFVLIFFAMYLVIPILFAARQPPELKGLVDATLVFGTPLSVAFMQASLVRDMPYGLAWSAGCGAGLYALLALTVIRREGLRLLGETYIALSVVLATLAIFFALDAYPTFALWSLEGAAIVWAGLRQQRVLARAFGLLVQLAGAGYFVMHYNDYTLANPWFNDFTLGCALIFFASTITAWLMNKYRAVLSPYGITVAFAMLIWGGGWWLVGWLHALHYGVTADYFASAALMVFGVSALVAEWAGARLAWIELRKMTRVHLSLMALVGLHWFSRALSSEGAATHPLAQAGYAAWPFNFGVLFWCLHRQMRDQLTTTASPRYYGGWMLMALLATWMATWLQLHDKYEWAMAWGALGIGIGWVRYRLREFAQPEAWPVSVAALGWGLAFWFVPGLSSIHQNFAYAFHVASGLGFATASVIAFEIIGSLLNWAALRRAQLVLLLAMVVALAAQFERQAHPFADYGFLAWGAAFVVLFVVLSRHARAQILIAGDLQNFFVLAMLATVLTWEVGWLMAHAHYELSWLMGVAVLTAAYWRFRWRERDIPEAVAISTGALIWSLAVWLASGWRYVAELVPYDLHVIGGFAYVVVSVALFEATGSWLKWTALRRAQLALPLFMLYTAAYQFLHHSHPFADYGWVVWPAAFAAFYVVLVRHDRDGIAVAASAQRLFAAALLAVLLTWEAGWLLAHHHYELAAALGFAAIGGAYLRFHLRERNDPQAPQLSPWALVWGLIVWLLAGLGYVDERIAPASQIACGLGWVVATCALAELAGSGLRWNALRAVEILLPPAMAVAFAMQIDRHLHPAAGYAGFAWLAAFVALYAILYRQQKEDIGLGARLQHLFAIWVATGVGAWESAWQLDAIMPATSWPFAMWGLVPAAVLFALARYGRLTWPWQQEFGFFRNAGFGPIALYCVAWSLLSNVNPGNGAPLPYLPLLNPVDIAQAAALFGLYAWLKAADMAVMEREKHYPVVLAALGFVWVNSIVLRSIHHWVGVPYIAHELFNSIVVQAAFSILWTLTAMVMMVMGTRKLQRPPWFTGAALLTVVVGKLFLLDLANSGTVARIVSFLGVGVLLMIIGYTAPVPPGDTEKQQG